MYRSTKQTDAVAFNVVLSQLRPHNVRGPRTRSSYRAVKQVFFGRGEPLALRCRRLCRFAASFALCWRLSLMYSMVTLQTFSLQDLTF